MDSLGKFINKTMDENAFAGLEEEMEKPVDLAVERSEGEKLEGETGEATNRSAPAFFGQENFKPAYELKKEEPQHRAICILAAQGETTSEIAEKLGFTTAMVAYVKKQHWAQKLIADMQQDFGSAAVKNVLTGAAAEAAKVMIQVMNGEIAAKPAERIKASADILNRVMGTAPHLIRHETKDVQEMTNEELAAVIAAGNN